MKVKANLITGILVVMVLLAQAQIPVGEWRDHYSYSNARNLSVSGQTIYCVTDNGFFTYNIESGEIDKFTKTNILSDIDLTALSFDSESNTIAVGYEDGNIDLIVSGTKKNLPFLKEKTIIGSKRINRFTFYNGLIYASTDIGIIVVDPQKREFRDTYFLGDMGSSLPVYNLIVWNNYFWAATSQGLKQANVDDPLLVSYQHWQNISAFTNESASCSDIAVSGTQFFAVEKQTVGSDVIWKYNGITWQELDRPFSEISYLNANESKLLATSPSGVQTYYIQGGKGPLLSTYTVSSVFQPKTSIPIDADRIAIADSFNGLIIGTVSEQQSVKPNGPQSNLSFAMGVTEGKLIVAAGAYDDSYSNRWKTFNIHFFESEKWFDYFDWNGHDAVSVKFDPQNSDNFYVASWGDGLYQFHGQELVNHFTPDNSTLQTILPNAPYCRISGMDFDSKGNLWVANSEVANPISVYKTDGTWTSFSYATSINADYYGSLTYSPYGSLWLVLPRGGGLFVLNPGNDIGSKDDDNIRKLTLRDGDGNLLSQEINSLSFDSDGYLWLGTSQGVLVSYNPASVFNGQTYFQKIKIPDVVEGLAVYLLETEEVNVVTVDAGNRKWFGTAKSGAYLFSSDGTKQTAHYTFENSPLPSNDVLDIKVDPASGEVFFATDKGVVSLRGDATKTSDSFGKVYAFPNPVRPTFKGVITIVGLMENTTVKITDVSGNLVYETQSIGGSATWDGNLKNGKRVPTGVYIVFCASETGEKTAVTKLLVVN